MLSLLQLKTERKSYPVVEKFASAAENDLHSVSGEDVDDLIAAINKRLDGGKAAQLIVDYFPSLVPAYRHALEQESGLKPGESTTITSSRLGSWTKSLAYTALAKLNERLARANDPNDTAFYETAAAYLTRSGFLDDADIKGASYGETKKNHGDYIRADARLPKDIKKTGDKAADLKETVKRTDIIISGSDASEKSLRAIYRKIVEMHKKGWLRDKPEIDEDAFVTRFQMDSDALISQRGLAGGCKPIDPKERIPLEEVRPRDEANQMKIRKIRRLAHALGLDEKNSMLRDDSDTLERIAMNTAPAGEYHHIPLLSGDIRLSGAADRGQKILDALNEELYGLYLRQSQGLDRSHFGERRKEGMRGELSLAGDHNDDAFSVVIPAYSMSDTAVGIMLSEAEKEHAQSILAGARPPGYTPGSSAGGSGTAVERIKPLDHGARGY